MTDKTELNEVTAAAKEVKRVADAAASAGIDLLDVPFLNLDDPEGLAAMMDECSQCDWGSVQLSRIDAHINDAAFVRQVLTVFDDWLAQGVVVVRLVRRKR